MDNIKDLNRKNCLFTGKYKGHIVSDITPYEFDEENISVYCFNSMFASANDFVEFYPGIWQKFISVSELSDIVVLVKEGNNKKQIPITMQELREVFGCNKKQPVNNSTK